mmetsp:Transcript_76640/g.228431  ORF Transcript_76640/g.228431 Transcript_76640/m.228431 type:complete len:222 (-) Transcript_76640:308-973(-)
MPWRSSWQRGRRGRPTLRPSGTGSAPSSTPCLSRGSSVPPRPCRGPPPGGCPRSTCAGGPAGRRRLASPRAPRHLRRAAPGRLAWSARGSRLEERAAGAWAASEPELSRARRCERGVAAGCSTASPGADAAAAPAAAAKGAVGTRPSEARGRGPRGSPCSVPPSGRCIPACRRAGRCRRRAWPWPRRLSGTQTAVCRRSLRPTSGAGPRGHAAPPASRRAR